MGWLLRNVGSRRSFYAAFITLALLVALPSIAPAEVAPGSSDDRAGLVPWGGQAFTTDDRLARWLRARGADYEIWANAHAQAAALLEGRAIEARAPVRQSPDWTAFNLPIHTTLYEADRSGPLIHARDLTVGAAVITADGTAGARPANTSPQVEENLGLLTVAAAVLIALLLFVVAGLTGIPSFENRAPALIVSHRPQLAAGGISILLCAGLIFVLTAGST